MAAILRRVDSHSRPTFVVAQLLRCVPRRVDDANLLGSAVFWGATASAALFYLISDSRLFWYLDDWDYLGSGRSLHHDVVHSLLAAHGG